MHWTCGVSAQDVFQRSHPLAQSSGFTAEAGRPRPAAAARRRWKFSGKRSTAAGTLSGQKLGDRRRRRVITLSAPAALLLHALQKNLWHCLREAELEHVRAHSYLRAALSCLSQRRNGLVTTADWGEGDQESATQLNNSGSDAEQRH